MEEETPEQLHAALLADPTDWFARRHLTERALGLGQPVYAAKLLNDAPEIPRELKSQLLAAQVFASQDTNLALNYIDNVLRMDELHPYGNLLKAKILINRRSILRAQEYYVKAISYDPVLRDRKMEATMGIEAEVQIRLDGDDDVEHQVTEALSLPPSAIDSLSASTQIIEEDTREQEDL